MASIKKFSVVLFTKDNTFAVVPSTWVEKDSNQCFWPGRKTRNPTKLAENSDSLPDSTFKRYNIEFVKSYDDYGRAKIKAETLKNSDKPEIPESSDTDAGRGRKVDSPAIVNEVASPPLGNLYGDIIEEEVNGQQVQAPANPSSSASYTFVDTAAGQPITFVSDPLLSELKAKFEGFQEECLTKFEELKSEVRDIKNLLRHVLDKFESNPGSSHALTQQDRHAYPTLPLRSKEELKQADEALENREQFDLLVQELKRIGGYCILVKTVPKNVYNILRHLISHKLALEVRFTDKSGKTAFGETQLAKAVRDAVIATPRERTPDESTINDLIGKWFRNSIERQSDKILKKPVQPSELDHGNPEVNPKTTNTHGRKSINEEYQREMESSESGGE